jgi:protein gp37
LTPEISGTFLNVFCASLADVFEEHTNEPLEQWREDLHKNLILETPNLNWQILTKRPENIAKFYNGREIPFNVWLGTSVESQEWAEKRIPHLLANDAPVRFLSCEPLLGPLDLRPWLGGKNHIEWVIAGGESGDGWRAMNPDWVRSIRDQCQEFGVPFFFKQWAHRFAGGAGYELDGREWSEFPE